MVAALTWYIVLIGGSQYIGPMNEDRCKAAAMHLQDDGYVCRQPSFTYACQVPGIYGANTICPHFDFSAVTIKQKDNKQ